MQDDGLYTCDMGCFSTTYCMHRVSALLTHYSGIKQLSNKTAYRGSES